MKFILIVLLSALALVTFVVGEAVTETITATIYADNYFEFYVDGTLIKSDPIDFTPHQAVQFTFTVTSGKSRQYAIKANDFATTSGYEYTNTSSPQIGDGALIMSFSDGVVSNAAWKCFTTSYGPTPESTAAGCSSTHLDLCKVTTVDEPENWKLSSFDDSAWSSATLYTSAETGWGRAPTYDSKTGLCSTLTDPYTGEKKDPSAISLPASDCLTPQSLNFGKASFIWQGDLNLDNTILCRYTVA